MFYLDLPAGAAKERQKFGSERYEKEEFQELVKEQFMSLKEESWRVVNAANTIESIHHEVLETVTKVIEQKAQEPIKQLWTTDNDK